MSEEQLDAKHRPFCFAALSFYRQFVQNLTSGSRVLVSISLRGKSDLFSIGLDGRNIDEAPHIVAIYGKEPFTKVVVVRDEDILSMEFSIFEQPSNQNEPSPFGFYPRR